MADSWRAGAAPRLDYDAIAAGVKPARPC